MVGTCSPLVADRYLSVNGLRLPTSGLPLRLSVLCPIHFAQHIMHMPAEQKNIQWHYLEVELSPMGWLCFKIKSHQDPAAPNKMRHLSNSK
eukprot:3275529-Amphidinium_carterae.1